MSDIGRLGRPLRVVALVKQVPALEQMQLGADGRLRREGLPLEMNPPCRRAVSKGVELAAATGGTCTALTLGPPSAEDCIREAIAWGATDGVLVCDPAFAGSDTLATARALAGAIRALGAVDLVLTGLHSVDAETGQVAPQVAELLGLPFAAGVIDLAVDHAEVRVRCQHDDGSLDAALPMPAVLAAAERLCEPCKVDEAGRAAVDGSRITRTSAAELGAGPWGRHASPTSVGEVRGCAVARERLVLAGGDVDDAVERAVGLLASRGAFEAADLATRSRVADHPGALCPGRVGVLLEPGREQLARELLGEAARLAAIVPGGAATVGIVPAPDADEGARLAGWGADELAVVPGALVAEDVATAVAAWVEQQRPWAILAASTTWGREVAARVAARTGSGLTGDATELEVQGGRLVAWKPAFGGAVLAAIHCASATQMVTVRPGVLPVLEPRDARGVPGRELVVTPKARVAVSGRERDPRTDVLARATAVVGVGLGVPPDEYGSVEGLLGVLDAELAATRKVTDRGWLPRWRQVGITGRSIAPRLYVALGVSGRHTHMAGVRRAGTVLAVNCDPAAPIFEACDIGIVEDWRLVVPALVARIGRRRESERRSGATV